MPKLDAIDLYCAMREGDQFTLRGREYAVRVGGPGGCFTSYSASCSGGERWAVPVWNDKGRAGLATIRPNSKLVVGEHACRWEPWREGECSQGACDQCTLCGALRHYTCSSDPLATERGKSHERQRQAAYRPAAA